MNVTVQLEFKSDRKEPLGEMIRRIAAIFEHAGVGPRVVATFSDAPGGIRITSAVERALKKHPHLSRLERNDGPVPGALLPPIRRLSGGDTDNPFPMADILALADGVPRSLPFHAVSVHFMHPDFGQTGFPTGLAPPAGVAISDGWWVNGRTRTLTAMYAVDGDANARRLPDPPAPVATVLAALGKPRRASQFVVPDAAATPGPAPPQAPTLPKEVGDIRPIVAKYRAGMADLMARVALPHDLPPANEVRQAAVGAGGPLKPALVEAFAPRGYDCRGESGTFRLRRRTALHHVIELELDVGTWSRSVTVMFRVHGPGFQAILVPPVSVRAGAGRYPIGDTASWRRIVANIGAILDELEHTFVPEIEAAVGAAPEWFEP